MEQLISLILKVAKEQGYCFPGNKVMIFTVENEGQSNETAAFRMIDIDEEWITTSVSSIVKLSFFAFAKPLNSKYIFSSMHFVFWNPLK